MDIEFRDLAVEIIENWWERSPVSATFEGIHKYDYTLDRFDEETHTSFTEQQRSYLSELEEIDSGTLSEGDRIDCQILKNAIRSELSKDEEIQSHLRKASLYPEIALYGTYIMMLRNYAPLSDRMENVSKRLAEVPHLLEEGVENLIKGENIPRIWTEVAIEVTEAGNGFWGGFVPREAHKVPDLKEDILHNNAKALKAFDCYLHFLKDELLPVSNGHYAIGEEMFDFLLEVQHGLPYTSQDLLKIGTDIIEGTTQQLEETASLIDRSKPWQQILEEMKDSHPQKDDLIITYVRAMEEALVFIGKRNLVTVPDDQFLEIIETPAFERTTVPYAAYISPAPFEEEQKGFFWVTPVDENKSRQEQEDQLKGHSTHNIPLVALHEAYPGHHLQLVLSNRLESIVRRQIQTNVFVEGWALYCEEMMHEQGFYSDPRGKLLQLKDQLWRGCRVVIDVKLHNKSMTFDEAVAMLVEIAKLERVNAIAEVKRYTYSPTQPMSYAIGKLQIMQLRSDYKKMMGDDFNLKEFHDTLLGFGGIPIQFIRESMNL